MIAKVKATGEIVKVFESVFHTGLWLTADRRVFDYMELEFVEGGENTIVELKNK